MRLTSLGAAWGDVADTRGYDGGFGQPLRREVPLKLGEGSYRLRILNPVTVEWSDGGTIGASGEKTRIALPEFRQDCVVVLSAK